MKRLSLSLAIPILLAPLLVASLSSCGSGNSDCNDGSDNDGDGLIDSLDPGCLANGDAESPDPSACNDGKDNDDDGLVDTEDPGCADINDNDEFNEPVPACNDGIDNDGDGLVDFPNDPGCDLTLEDSEDDPCPGENCPACGNGIDDDGDGNADYPDDLGCNSASDTDEFNADPSICGANVSIQPLPASNEVSGFIAGNQSNQLISPECQGTGQEHVYIYTPTAVEHVIISTDFPETEINTLLYMRTDCMDGETELGCSDEAVGDTLEFDRVEPGTYYIIVDSHGQTTGNYRLKVERSTPQGEPCESTDQCFSGLVCRNFVEDGNVAATTTCELPECQDGQDSDNDGLVDFPQEPGCDSPEDNDETDTCDDDPVGEDCPQCGNGGDDDGDNLSDFPADPGCSSASDDLEVDDCFEGLPLGLLTEAGLSGTTPAGSSLMDPSCDSFTSTEDAYVFNTDRDLSSLTFATSATTGSVALSVREEICDSEDAEVACRLATNASVTIEDPTPGADYFVLVDGSFSANLSYNLNVSGLLRLGASCVPNDTAFVCNAADFLVCDSTSELCRATQCSDGVSNGDGDTLVDAADPGCTSFSDDDETDPVPLPQCSDGVDNDDDNLVDYPADTGCQFAGGNLELNCADSDPIVAISTPTTTGTTVGATGDFQPTCGSTSSSPDISHTLVVPGELLSLVIDTDGSEGNFDTVLHMRSNSCDLADEFACDDDGSDLSLKSRITLASVPAGTYFVIVDGYAGDTGAYSLNVTGVIRSGQACLQEQIAAGIFSCEGATTCTAGICQ